MRIAAGIVLIIAAVMNVFGAMAYLGGGALVSGASSLSKMAEEEMKKSGQEMTAEQKQAMASLQDAKTKVSTAGWMPFGAFLLVTAVISIIGAVSLFQGKRAKFILVAAILVIAGEVIGTLMTGFGIGKIIGLAAAVLAIIAARGIMAGSSGGGQGHPAVAA
jgi:hypothetical protein